MRSIREDVEDVVAGCVTAAGEQGACIARMATLAAAWPTDVTGVTLNRFCGSGQQAVNFAMMGVLSGQQDLVVGGGVESMSRQPMGSDGSGIDGHNRHLREMYPARPAGHLRRSDRDHRGLHAATTSIASRSRASSAPRRGAGGRSFHEERRAREGSRPARSSLDHDEFPRPQTTLEALGTLEPSFVQLRKLRAEGRRR